MQTMRKTNESKSLYVRSLQTFKQKTSNKIVFFFKEQYFVYLTKSSFRDCINIFQSAYFCFSTFRFGVNVDKCKVEI